VARNRDLDPAPFEVELWFRSDASARGQAAELVGQRIRSDGGRVIAEAVVPEIRYHALVGELPPSRIDRILAEEDAQLIRADQVMFLRPSGQTDLAGPMLADDGDGTASALEATSLDPPILGLLDGLPLANHTLLSGRLIVDDADGWGGDYAARDRQHGTAMASLLVNGDVASKESPLTRSVYVRPVLRPDPHAWVSIRREQAPPEVLFPDLIRRAVNRMLLGEGEEGAAAPSVELINFSVGDPTRPFDGMMSPLARVLDWLSFEHGVLFVTSAGNQMANLTLSSNSADFAALLPEDRQTELLRAVIRDAHVRRLLSPGESINAVTVGRTHGDLSGPGPFPGASVDAYISPRLPACSSALGSGFRRAVKPDVVLSGGRQMVELNPGNAADPASIALVAGPQPPGQQVAAPGLAPTLLSGLAHCGGTSNSAALTSRALAHARDVLAARLAELEIERPGRRIWAAVLKALAAHGATWGEEADTIGSAIGITGHELRPALTRFLGYGQTDIDRASRCTDQRVTLLGWGELDDGEAHSYEIPIPLAISGQAVGRQLTITLAWLSPIVPGSRRYRGASLWVAPPTDELQVRRLGPDWQQVQRGTIQHEVLRGEQATVISPGDTMEIKVNCRADAGPLRASVPYGLMVTLEVDESIDLPIYAQVASAIRPSVRVGPRAR
jgi:hypothetical protein